MATEAEADFTIKQNDFGDREPLRATLEQLVVDAETGEPVLDGEGQEQFEPIDLTGKTIHGLLESASKVKLKTGSMTIVGEPKKGIVEYQFAAAGESTPADLAIASDYKLEFEILGAEGKSRQSVPNVGYYLLRVEASSGP